MPEEEQDGNNSESGFLEHAEDAPEDELRKSSESLDSGWETDLEIEGKVYNENNLRPVSNFSCVESNVNEPKQRV